MWVWLSVNEPRPLSKCNQIIIIIICNTEEGGKEMAGNDKPVCKYGSSCYRKNPNHFKQYFHPEDAEHKKVMRLTNFESFNLMNREDASCIK